MDAVALMLAAVLFKNFDLTETWTLHQPNKKKNLKQAHEKKKGVGLIKKLV